ncbi:phage terminase, partial [Trabulsiella guamensis ATCC 49490]
MTFNASDVLLPYQKRWIADDSPLKIAEKSRRTGLTWAEASDAALTASLRKVDGGSDHFYIGTTKEMAREFIDACAMWAKAFNAAASDIGEEVVKDEGRDILTFVINFASGFKIKALSSNPSNIRGMQGNVTIDEAAFHERLDELLKAVTPLRSWGGKIRLISTHNGIDNLFNQLIQESRAGKKDYRIHTITLDDACDDGLYRRICQVRGLDWSPDAEADWKEGLLRNTATRDDALEEYYCVPKNGSGAYIPRSLRERAARGPCVVLRFTGTPEFSAMPEGQRRIDMQD